MEPASALPPSSARPAISSVVQAPLTVFIIILEITGSHANVIPRMCASVPGYGTARLISSEPLYHALSRIFVAEALRSAARVKTTRQRNNGCRGSRRDWRADGAY